MASQPVTLLRLPQVISRVGLKKAAIYSRLDANSRFYDPSFPRPIKTGQRCVAWVESEIDTWIQSKIDATRQSAA
jgi:prophage regulatory protein